MRVRSLYRAEASAWSPASNEVETGSYTVRGICGRTARVRDRILTLLKYRHSYKGGCGAVTETELAKLTSLDLRRNPSTESAFTMRLRQDDFEGLWNLVELDLADTGLRSLPAGVFDGLTDLETLRLNNNRLGSLPAGVFSGLRSLEKLLLYKNPSLRSLPYDELEVLPDLTELRVDRVGRRKLQVAGGETDAVLEVPAGGTATYQVRLMAGLDSRVTTTNPLTIEASSDTAGVTASPAIRFTKENWFRRQTVTVRAAASASGTARLEHEASGTTTDTQGTAQSNYDFEQSLPGVTVQVRELESAAGDMRDHALRVTGGAVTDAARVDGRDDLWRFTVTPSGAGDIEIELPVGRACAEAGAICTADGTELSTGLLTIVLGDVQDASRSALTAAFEDVPAGHDGESAFRFRVAFSEDIGISYRALREDAFVVTGGRVTRGTRVDDRRDLFEITVQPDGAGAVTIKLPGGRDCATSGAICAKGENRRPLTNSPSATVAGPAAEAERNTAATGAPAIRGTPQVGEELTASTSGISDADGLDNASFAYQWIRTDTDVQGATGSTYTATADDEGKKLKVRVSFIDDAGNEESLTSAATDAVAAAAEPLTASFSGMPSEHAGQGTFRFRVEFSDEIRISYKTLRDTSFTLTNGDITGARRVDGRRDLWEMTVAPAPEPLTIRLPETRDCAASGAVCTGDGRPLSHSLTATVAVAAAISVADAQVEEDDGAVLAFGVTLDRAAGGTVTVDYATANGTATAGEDYTATSGTLRFPAGETSKTIEVAVLDDSHDEGEETLTLRLSNPVGGRLTDGEATGTIENRDPLPKAFMARFGRTVAVQVVEQVEERIQAPRRTGFEGRVAGRELRRGMEREVALGFLNRLGGLGGANRYGAGPDTPMAGSPAGGAMLGRPGPSGGGRLDMGLGSMGFGGDSLLTGSSFALNRETGSGGILSFWSRGVQSQFYGREGDLSLDGRGRTTMFGADYATGPLLVGLSLAHSRGRGGYSGADAGVVTSSVTGLYPWLGYKVTDRITLWGVTGYGKGAL